MTNAKTYPHYQVKICAKTGEWLNDPVYIGRVDAEAWHAMKDTDCWHTRYAAFEYFDESFDHPVRWVDQVTESEYVRALEMILIDA